MRIAGIANIAYMAYVANIANIAYGNQRFGYTKQLQHCLFVCVCECLHARNESGFQAKQLTESTSARPESPRLSFSSPSSPMIRDAHQGDDTIALFASSLLVLHVASYRYKDSSFGL